MTNLIEMRGISKYYRGVPAIKDVNFELKEAEIHALIGENGAGKSTLTKIVAGVTQPSSGTMLLRGEPVTFQSPSHALKAGISMVYQETSLVPSMTVAQNLYLGDEPSLIRLRGISIAAQQFLQSLNFPIDPWALVSTLGAAKKQMVEIARAVRQDAKVIIFDEPTATLTPEEKQHFFALLDRLKARGVSIIFITHALEEALTCADRITILQDGVFVHSAPARSLDRKALIGYMVGRELSEELYAAKGRSTRPPRRRILSVNNLSMGNLVRNTSFSIYEGQITGIFGLIGSGRTETAKIIAGILKRNALNGGNIEFAGKPVRYKVPRPAVRDGIVYVTEDRKAEGFFETMSISENIDIGAISAVASFQDVFSSHGKMKAIADEWRKKLKIRTINANARVVELSGGNQQKVVIASALVQKPRLIIFDEPTRGVDVGAIAEIHQIINGLADDGIAVVVISSYLPEIMNLSDRILVSRAGRIVEEFTPNDATQERIMYAAVH